MICIEGSHSQVRLCKDDVAEAITQFLNNGQYSSIEVEVIDLHFHGSGSVYVVTADVVRKGSTLKED